MREQQIGVTLLKTSNIFYEQASSFDLSFAQEPAPNRLAWLNHVRRELGGMEKDAPTDK